MLKYIIILIILLKAQGAEMERNSLYYSMSKE